MKLAIVITGSGYINLFYNIGNYLKSKEIEVVYVSENKYEIHKEGYQELFKKERAYFLIDFRKKHKNSTSKQKYEWLPLFSNFDRTTTYGFNATSVDLEKMLIAGYELWDYLFEKEKIDGVIFENVAETVSYIAYLRCLQYKKRYIAIMIPSWLSGRLRIFNDLYGIDEISRLFHIYLKKDEEIFDLNLTNLYRRIISPMFSPNYMDNNPTSVDYSLVNHYLRKLYLIKKYISYYFKEYWNMKKSFMIKNPFQMAWRLLIRGIKRKTAVKIMIAKHYLAKPDYNEKFLIYPLHFHPEASTLINAWPFIDELSVIKNVAFSLPDGYKLYVKAHPNGFGYEGIKFYKRIKAIPRVKLIHYSINPTELISKSSGIITLTSTMGFEALMLKKPVFVFGNIFYQIHPYCNKIENLYSLPEILVKGLNKEYDQKKFERYNLTLLKAYYDSTFPGKFDLSKKPDSKNIKRIGDEILKSLKN